MWHPGYRAAAERGAAALASRNALDAAPEEAEDGAARRTLSVVVVASAPQASNTMTLSRRPAEATGSHGLPVFDLIRAACPDEDRRSRRERRKAIAAVWQLETDVAMFAVKDVFEPPGEHVARATAQFQDVADATGVLTPSVVRTANGDVFAHVHDAHVRVYRWVDLRGPDLGLDPVQLATIVADIHGLGFAAEGGPDRWYSAPVGAQRWDEIIDALREHAAPFAAELRSLRTELLALEQWITLPGDAQMCQRDLWADNVQATGDGTLCVFDWENSGPADPGARLRAVRVRRHRHGPRAHALPGIPRRRRTGPPRKPRRVLDAHRPTRSHPRTQLPPMA